MNINIIDLCAETPTTKYFFKYNFRSKSTLSVALGFINIHKTDTNSSLILNSIICGSRKVISHMNMDSATLSTVKAER